MGQYIGPGRDRRTVPVRELTFQALKPNTPGGWRVVNFGQSPYPRVESATGIAHFDNTISRWEDSRFSVVLSMRTIIKAAVIHKFGGDPTMTMANLRHELKKNKVVGPAEWFQAMLVQGVLFMNAALTLIPPEEKGVRAGAVVGAHTVFWMPVIEAVVDAILSECGRQGKGIVFAWWGSESLKTRDGLKNCFKRHLGVKVEHCVHKHPAARKDGFCDEPNVFGGLNQALEKLELGGVDWLPTEGWKDNGSSHRVAEMGDFIAETQDLHKMYLDRLRDGLSDRRDDLADITGIEDLPLQSLQEACSLLHIEKQVETSMAKADKMERGSLTVDEAAAVHLYTTNALYSKMNAALRNQDRTSVKAYMLYLKLFFQALAKMESCKKNLYRGVGLDLFSGYTLGSTVTWWAASSCSPNLSVAKAFGAKTGGTLFHISARSSVSIRHLSEYKDEEEFLLAPGTQLQVTKVGRSGLLTEVYLDELDLPRRVR